MTRKEELKAEYKLNRHRLRTMGVYQIKNLANGKVYLDGSLNLEGTMDRDQLWLQLGSHLNKALQAEWNQYGADAFRHEILETLTPTDEPRDYKDELALLLEVWAQTLQPYGDRGYLPAPRR